MKWNKTRVGETRIKKKFLLFPLCLEGEEYRWLEMAFIEQECSYIKSLAFVGGLAIPCYKRKWINIKFIDDNTNIS